MTDIVLSPITSGYNVSKINANFTKIATAINSDVLHVRGGNNTMYQDLDMNSFALLNVQTNVGNPDSLLTVADGDARYYNIDGDTLAGTMNVNGETITGLKVAEAPTEAVRKSQLDDEANARTSADQSLQDQINGVTPPMGSAFSIISWHDQVIENSILIPDNKNAWSFGPTISVAAGQTVEIGTNSFWTVANGATAGSGVLSPEIPDPLDMGMLP
jgi:hypothetical protein